MSLQLFPHLKTAICTNYIALTHKAAINTLFQDRVKVVRGDNLNYKAQDFHIKELAEGKKASIHHALRMA